MCVRVSVARKEQLGRKDIMCMCECVSVCVCVSRILHVCSNVCSNFWWLNYCSHVPHGRHLLLQSSTYVSDVTFDKLLPRGGGLGSSTIFKKINEPYVPS